MEIELTRFFGRGHYERIDGKVNHRNGFHLREFTLKGIGKKVDVKVSGDREGEFKTDVILKSNPILR